jgi:type I restriction enzyme S subunit
MNTVPNEVQCFYGALPEGWRLEKMKFSCVVRNSNVDKVIAEDEEAVRLCNYTDVYYNDRITPDLEFKEGSATQAEIDRFQLKRGQVIITKDSESWEDIGIPALVSEDMPDILCGYHLSVLDPIESRLDGGYLAWLCRSAPLNNQFKLGANGVTRFGLGQYPMKSAFIALPPPETQCRIAQFLNGKTVQIDALIEKKRALLDRLAEKRQALITHAVTKGLDLNALMRDSGIDWLGEIPAHWEVRGLTKCTTRVDYRGATPQKTPSGVFLVTARNIRNGSIDYNASQEFIAEEDYDHVMRRGKPKLDEILLTTEAPLGEVARVDREDIALAQRVIKFASSISNLSNAYLAYWLQSEPFRFDLLSRATGSTALGIKASKIVELRCLIPSAVDQERIVNYLERMTRALDDVCDEVSVSIVRLAEYRSALITTAVIGKLNLEAA